MAAPDTSFLLQEAIDRHQQGAFADARDRYAEIIRREPKNVDALYLSGLAQCHLREFKDAVKHLRRAVSLAPEHAAAHNTLSMALRETGRIEDALASSNDAIASDQSFAEAHANRGDILQDLRRPEEALAAYERALALAPDLVAALVNRGSLLQTLGRHEEALDSYDRAIALVPDLAEAWLNRSKALHVLGRWDDALASCDRAIAAQPGLLPALLARAILLADRGQFGDALACIDRALAVHPTWPQGLLERASILHKAGDPEAALANCERVIAASPHWFAAWQLRARLLHDLSRLDEALTSIERALTLEPGLAEAHAFRGAMLIKCNRPVDAVAALDHALSIDPDRGTIHVDRGLALHALGRYGEAFEALDRGCRIEADNPHVQFVAGLVDLLHGRWEEGFRRYERRLEVPGFSLLHRRFLKPGSDIDRRFASQGQVQELQTFPRWNGEPTREPILLETEQGIGDSIQFAGLAARLIREGQRVQLLTLPALAPLLRTLAGVETVIDNAQDAEQLAPQHWLPLMSLPHVLKLRADQLAFDVPYLSTSPEKIAAWKTRLGEDGFRVGIAWQGNNQNWIDAGRSIPLRAFEVLATLPGVRLISLQKQPGPDQIEQVPFGDRIERLIDESDKGPEAPLETAALLANLDLVVTSDSMIAHLAGALGRPTFVALRRVPEWRWQLDRQDSPFYPTMRLFRQRREGDWAPVFAEIADAVRVLANAKAHA
ncbi:MAG: tetratricopeptide repeat protein [Xanthobacteraceae bacterium]|nr:tetratricopeptide repeat protein [Xanthobacteraceae bacterium]